MIIELLTPDASSWDAAAVMLRATYHAASIGAAGAAVALLVFLAAAEMVSIHPLDAGHRVNP